MNKDVKMKVKLQMDKIENCLLKAYNKIERKELNLPKNLTKDSWNELMNDATGDFWETIDVEDNIYFIFDDKRNLLDVGKSKDIRGRLKQHFVSKPQGTSSKIEELQKYVLDEQRFTLYVSTLKIDPAKYYQMAEAFYIDRFSPPWNNRKD